MSLREDYAISNVPMLPLVIGDSATAWIILAHTITLVLLSLLPVAFGLGFIYFAGAVIGGALFVQRSIVLVLKPGPKAAMSNFYASLIHLGLLLITAIIDSGLNL